MTLLAATGAGAVRVVELDSGRWSVEPGLEAADVRCLAVDGEIVYAGGDDGVRRSADGGRSWEASGLGGLPVRSLAAGGGTVYAGTKEPRVYVRRDPGRDWRPLAPFSRLRSWWWAQPAERPFRPTYVSAIALSGDAVVVGIEACGVLRTTDGGRSWSGHRPRALRDCHELLTADGSVYEAGSGGFAESVDGGHTWRRRQDGLDRRYGWSVASAEEALFVAVAPYRSAHTGNSRSRVFRALGDGPWQPCTDELSSLPRLRAVRGTVFAALGDGTLQRSVDRGDTWETLPVDLGGAARALVALDG